MTIDVTFSIKPTHGLAMNGYDYEVRIDMPGLGPFSEAGHKATMRSASKAVRRRVRRVLGMKHYMRVRRSMP